MSYRARREQDTLLSAMEGDHPPPSFYLPEADGTDASRGRLARRCRKRTAVLAALDRLALRNPPGGYRIEVDPSEDAIHTRVPMRAAIVAAGVVAMALGAWVARPEAEAAAPVPPTCWTLNTQRHATIA